MTKPEEPLKRPGPESDSLKIDLPWEEAARRLVSAPVPPGGVPKRETQKRERGAGRPRKK